MQGNEESHGAPNNGEAAAYHAQAFRTYANPPVQERQFIPPPAVSRRHGEGVNELLEDEEDEEIMAPTQRASQDPDIPTQYSQSQYEEEEFQLQQPSQSSQLTQLSNMSQATQAPRVSLDPQGTARAPQRQRGGNYSKQEKNILLDIIEKHLPVGNAMWDVVYNDFERSMPGTTRDVKSIRECYRRMINSKMPTGDPRCPTDIRRAKRIQYAIHSQNAIGDISEENGGVTGMMKELAGTRKQLAAVAVSDESGLSDTPRPRLDGPSNLISKRPPASSKKSEEKKDLMETFMAHQQMMADRDLVERRRERREARREERRQQKMMLQLITVGMSMFNNAFVRDNRGGIVTSTDVARMLRRVDSNGSNSEVNDDSDSSQSKDDSATKSPLRKQRRC